MIFSVGVRLVMNRSGIVIKNAIWEFGYYFIVIALGFLAPRYIILVYGSEVNGLSSTIAQILIVILLLQAGATTAAVFSLYRPIAEHNQVDICRKVASAERFFRKISLIFAVAMIVGAVLTAVFIDSEIKEIYIFLAFVIMGFKSILDLYYTSKFRIVFTAFQEKFIISIATLIEQVVYYALVFATIFLRAHFLLIYVWLFLGCAVKVVYLKIVFKKKHSDIVTEEYKKETDKISGRNYSLANEVAHSIMSSSTMIILSFMYGLEEASIYSVYALVSSALNLFSTALHSAFAPSFGNLVAQQENENSRRIFRIFQFVFIMLNTLMMMCMLYLMIPFIKIYTHGASDINYINLSLALLLSLSGLVSAYRIPYNIVVSSYGFFKETWKQPVVTAIIAIMVACVFGKISYPFVLVGVIFFYIVNFLYQHFKLRQLVPYIISPKVFVMGIISLVGMAITYVLCNLISLPSGMIWWILGAIFYALISFTFIALVSYIFMKEELILTYTYVKTLIARRFNHV